MAQLIPQKLKQVELVHQQGIIQYSSRKQVSHKVLHFLTRRGGGREWLDQLNSH